MGKRPRPQAGTETVSVGNSPYNPLRFSGPSAKPSIDYLDQTIVDYR
jgi:hypothetical protein